MHKYFYASGFIYHLESQQILLQQDNTFSWSLFGQKGKSGQNPITVFQKAIFTKLGIKLALKSIIPVYDYFSKEEGGNHYVFYAQVKLKKKKFHMPKNSSAEWFTFKQITKLSFSGQIKQDIIVAERVIKAKARDEEAKQTPAQIQL